MLVAEHESGNGACSTSASNSDLLHDIEAISKALYLHEATQKSLISPSTQYSGKVGCVEHRLVPKPGNRDEKGLNKFNTWKWKKPLKALAHLRGRKFGCLFFLHVHSIEGLPANFDGVGLCVEFRRKDEVLKSRSSRVLRGTADFDDTLMHRCTVYCHKSGPINSCKYEPKLFSVCTSVIGAPGDDVGEHWVDLTRLLPLTLEELDGDKSSGKWTTSFKLAGKAKGATLNVSFGFSLVSGTNVESNGSMTVPQLIRLAYSRPSTKQNDRGFSQNDSTKKLRRSGSVPSDLNHPSLQFAQPLDVKMGHGAVVDPAIEFSKSIHYLYEKLDQDILSDKSGPDLSLEDLKLLKAKSDLCPEPVEDPIDDEGDDIDFVVIDRGIEVPQSKLLNPIQVSNHTQDSETEALNKNDTLIGNDLLCPDKMKCDLVDDLTCSTTAGLVIGDNKIGEQSVHAKQSALEVESTFPNALILDSADLGSLPASGYSKCKENYMSLKYSYKANKKGTKSLSSDDVSELVSSDFLHMLESEQSLSGSNFSGEPESPREQLLREFEREAFLSGNFIIDFNATEEQVRFGWGASVGTSSEDNSEDFILTSVLQDSEEEYEQSSPSLRHRRKVKMLEDLETEVLMREWGLDEKAFQNSPRCSSGGFGSPIELPSPEPVESPLLGEGFGPSIQTVGGGLLRTMIPSLFRNAKNGMNLIQQVSRPVVLPARMGSSNMKVLQHLASIEIEKLSKQIDKAMPLEDITGRTLQQVACEAAPKTVWQSLLQPKTASSQKFKVQECNLGCNNPVSDLAFLEDIVLSAVNKIEALTIEGLRTQCGMTDEEAPSSIIPHFEMPASQGKYANFHELMSLEDDEFHLYDVQNSGSDTYGLMDFFVTLDDWLRLDAGVSVGNQDETGESTRKILVAHHAKSEDSSRAKLIEGIHPDEASGMRSGLLQNNLTIAFRVQLRDPLRNFEAVGDPMLALVHVDRRYVHQVVSERRNEEEDDGIPTGDGIAISSFRITELHLAGIDAEPGKKHSWGTTRQQQLGTRWLLASGLGKATKQPLAKSKAVVKSSLGVKTKVPRADILWSISPFPYGNESNSKKSGITAHIRNPDIIFLNESIRSTSCI
ncbi:hypothetical protein BT93_B2773 [Corymbia citriodora subsp. variegata]|nr:hypothetical protein BT93_B2773 [Corymbia citriodora subsp. variegata]